MKIFRSTRFLTVIVALLSMLSMQLAVAAYACPGGAAGSDAGAAAAQAAMLAMPDCQGMDAMQPQLCHLHAHGELAKQPLDKLALLDVPGFVPAALLLDVRLLDAVLIPDAIPRRPVALTRTTAPPLAIRHCCFRI